VHHHIRSPSSNLILSIRGGSNMKGTQIWSHSEDFYSSS
jgi:hypothetical protein